MKLQRVALIIFYDTAGRILLQNRAGISTYGEKWGYFGGHIEEGETPKEAAVREVREELGLTLGQHEFVGVIENERYGDKVERHIFLAPLPVPVSDLTVRE
ncbi:MAG: NUDIX domain-containing protein, partial [Candidatus Micrarchaeia archaeon]